MAPSLPAEVSPDRVVILGANGFVATHLRNNLEKTRTPVRAIGREEINLGQEGAGTRLAKEIRPNDTLVFASAVTPDKGRDIGTFLLNLQMAAAVVSALQVQRCRHVIYLSSDAVYGWQTSLISESTPPSPADLYGTMHLARERMLGHHLDTNGIPFSVLRLCAVYGPGDTHNGYGPNRFLRQALAHQAITLFGEGEETRDHVFVDDVIAMIQACLRHPVSRVLNGVSGRSHSFRAVAAMVHRLVARGPGPTASLRINPVTHRTFDPTCLLRTFPAHRSTDLEEGLKLTLGAIDPA